MLRWLRERRRREADLERELRAHLAEEADEQIAAGVTPDEARLRARRAFGNELLVREDTRAAWGGAALDPLLQDLRYALRALVRNPDFSAVAVLSLALGIVANTAIFGIVDGLLLRQLPVEEPQRLFEIGLASDDSAGK